jgi:MarR family transcriptional regulator, organic hydroperoxide resistance regulator
MSRRAALFARAHRLPGPGAQDGCSPQRKRTARQLDRSSGYTPVFSADRHIGTALRETYRAFARALSQNIAPLGLTLSMWFALRCLWEVDGLSQAELGRRIEHNPAAVVAVLNALEAAGLVVRRRSRKDGRIYNVFLTPAGRQLRTKATALALQVDARAMRGVKYEEIEQVLATLKRLRGNLADPGQQPRTTA